MSKLSTTYDDILACARKLIASGGYNGFSYADIAEVVGVRKASIHHHFPSKVDLVKALLVQYRREAEAGVGNMQQSIPEPFAQLDAYIAYWKACLGDASAPFCVCALLASEMPILPEEVALEVRAYFRFLSGWLSSVLSQGAQQGAIALRDTAQVEAEAFMATVHGAMLSARAYGDAGIFSTIMMPQLERLTPSS
ncbi:TetR/AcrR family transcriptional regulator [Duganella sp. sic0402]|uniref:TetR/AcrR family transcriptional regulator n=1 Tax=Duganella sp. sic0402 TaxID=2854786 RepID=UPI001C484555|nr:TetR/AcrR family transcriptional regulator [Duganella sp. sic0402]MBV7534983.1 TetR/AcrR family transcriptional regulator [Duganella sp. sic0402]